MKKGLWVFICLCFAFSSDVNSPMECPDVNFRIGSPVRQRISMTGSFGEIRNNHFHAGTDIRSSHGASPDELLATGEGFISKIKIEAENYGKSLYIQHPGGFTTMYAHILKFRPDIDARIKMEQYKQEKFEIELNFTPSEFPVNQGDSVAYMGNTGSSRGTHLHFELRTTGTNEVLDPMDYGLPVDDLIAPIIRRIKIYGFNTDGDLISEKIYNKSRLTTKASVPGDILAIGVDASDHSDNSWNTTGIKSIKLFVDGGLFYHFTTDRWSLDDALYVNAHIDYRNKSKSLGNFHRCFKIAGNKLGLYKTIQNDGLFYMTDSVSHDVRLEVLDAKGNSSEINFKVQKSNYTMPVKTNPLPDLIKFDQPYFINFGSACINFLEGAFYDNLECKFDSTQNYSKLAYSPWIGIVSKPEPVHKIFDIKMRPNRTIPDHLKPKCFIAAKRGNQIINTGRSKWEDDQLISSYRQLTYFSIMVDTIPPSIIPITFRTDMTNKRSMSFKLSDNLTTPAKVENLKYNAYVDGQWVLMEYDKKSQSIRHEFESWLGKGKHELLISAVDERGNSRNYHASFIR
ncbi:MAG: M23 family metallopeptidase [Saprospiraceae bacterium]|nr:M23 family metallopeptidase [Saprospiraceae bacterium]